MDFAAGWAVRLDLCHFSVFKLVPMMVHGGLPGCGTVELTWAVPTAIKAAHVGYPESCMTGSRVMLDVRCLPGVLIMLDSLNGFT